ncbi:MAG TPA: hypothetical protein VKV77_11160 [Methylovirgula sp.]|nr:hypothetical protein [Methylovirgula sp.]
MRTGNLRAAAQCGVNSNYYQQELAQVGEALNRANDKIAVLTSELTGRSAERGR